MSSSCASSGLRWILLVEVINHDSPKAGSRAPDFIVYELSNCPLCQRKGEDEICDHLGEVVGVNFVQWSHKMVMCVLEVRGAAGKNNGLPQQCHSEYYVTISYMGQFGIFEIAHPENLPFSIITTLPFLQHITNASMLYI